jgi:aryl-alcohol dehydrogenase-like predicted oxidoreductase
VVDRVGEVARVRGLPPAQVALAWVLHQPAVTAPIVGATKSHHLEDAVGALSVTLSEEELKALEAPYVPHPLAGFE